MVNLSVAQPKSRRTIFLEKLMQCLSKRNYDLKTHCSDKTQPYNAQFYVSITTTVPAKKDYSFGYSLRLYILTTKKSPKNTKKRGDRLLLWEQFASELVSATRSAVRYAKKRASVLIFCG